MATRAAEGPRTPRRDARTIEFETQGVWTAAELGGAITAIDELHNLVLFAMKLGAERAIEYERVRTLWSNAPSTNPEFVLERLGPTPDLIERCLREPELFVNKSERLELVTIHIASPGGFSFRGLGSPIRVLRKFFRDLWDRKARRERLKQQLELGEIEIIRERMRLVTEYGLTWDQLERLTGRDADHVSKVRNLAAEGRLSLGPGPDESDDGGTYPSGPRPTPDELRDAFPAISEAELAELEAELAQRRSNEDPSEPPPQPQRRKGH